MDTFVKGKIKDAGIFLTIAGIFYIVSASIPFVINMTKWDIDELETAIMVSNITRLATAFFILISARQFVIGIKHSQ